MKPHIKLLHPLPLQCKSSTIIAITDVLVAATLAATFGAMPLLAFCKNHPPYSGIKTR